MMEVEKTAIEGLLIVRTRVFNDARGAFFEGFRADRFAAAGLPTEFLQDNFSHSKRNVLRGLHFQEPNGQGKFVRCVSGAIYDVAVDIRPGSKTFGRHVGIELSDDQSRGLALYIPSGFAHGFAVLSAEACVSYKCTTLYSPADEKGLRWDDPGLGIRWPVQAPLLSEKDEKYAPFREYAAAIGQKL